MIYIVSGYTRSGTSMMMQALIEGGLNGAYDIGREKMNENFGDEYYKPNVYGFFELYIHRYQKLNFPLDYKGKLIKIINTGLRNLSVHEYKIVYMLRNPEEIRQSYEAFFSRNLTMKLEEYEPWMNKHILMMKNRRDVKSIDVFQYREVLKDPLKYFSILREHGWPIDVYKSITTIDPSQNRFRIEELEVGIASV